MMISKKLILKKTDFQEQYVEKVENIFLNNGFLIDKTRDVIFKTHDTMKLKYSDCVSYHLGDIDKLIYLVNRGFQEPDEEGYTNNGLIGICLPDFMNNGDIETLEELYQTSVADIKRKGTAAVNA